LSRQTASPAAPTNIEIYQAQLRAQLGYESDIPYVRELNQSIRGNPNANPSIDPTMSTVAGIPVSAKENVEIKRRNVLALAIPAISSRLAADATFAGSWVDNLDSGSLNIAFTQQPSAGTLAAIDALMPQVSGAVAKISEVHTTLAALQLEIGKIVAAEDPDIQSAYVDQQKNSVVISIPDTADIGAESRINASFGSVPLVLTRNPPVAPASDLRKATSGTLIGGQLVYPQNGSNGGCTMGYSNLMNTLNQVYSVTAGHCGPSNSVWLHGGSAGDVIGTMHNSHGVGAGRIRCDCGPIQINVSIRTRYYLDSRNAVVIVSSSGTPAQGQLICHSGVTSWETHGFNVCGTVTDPYTGTYTADGFTLYSAIRVNIPATGGDSGAPLFGTSADGTTHRLYGILSGGLSGDVQFSNVAYLPDVGLRLLF